MEGQGSTAENIIPDWVKGRMEILPQVLPRPVSSGVAYHFGFQSCVFVVDEATSPFVRVC